MVIGRVKGGVGGEQDRVERQPRARAYDQPDAERQKADVAGARKAFEHGAELYAAGDFAHAVDEFERANALHHAPEISFTLAQALRRLGGREDEAREWFVKAMKGDTEGETDAVERLEQLDGIELELGEDDGLEDGAEPGE